MNLPSPSIHPPRDPRPALPPRTSLPSRAVLAGLAVALGLSLPAPATGADTLEEALAAEALRNHVPGLVVAVVRAGEAPRVAATGWADLELGVPATSNTVFQIQSITKTFTATAILLLVEEGRLALEDPVGRHLEGTPETWEPITVRHLLNHTSGIRDFINEPTASLRIDVTEEDVLRAAAPRPLHFRPGTRYAYSNTNYHLLAMILRKLTGKAYGEVLRERIFEPLGMAHTRVVSLSELIPNRASGYFWDGSRHRKGEFIAESILAYGGGGIVSTAPDMALWASAMLAGRILKPESRDTAWTPARLEDGSASSYGLGWGVASREGHREIGHTGAHATGFTSSLVLYPEDHLAVVVLQNCRGTDAAATARRIAASQVPALAPRPATPIPDRDSTGKTNGPRSTAGD